MRIFFLATLIVAISLLSVGEAFAQPGRRTPNLGIQKPYYGAEFTVGPFAGAGRAYGNNFGGAPWRGYYSQPASPVYTQPQGLAFSPAPLAESYRTLSIEPIGINPGDTVVVTRDDARLMMGQNVVGRIPQGLQFEVTKVVNGWLGAVVEVDGQQLKGWIWNQQVRPIQDAPPAPPGA